ncbi:predicted protein [Sclerotinia sclerotiorum 1980 UF-70]|uniref:Uncharacterized protein n=1 Tax=Sclerotinia sclerotiorum (strain ATCC 18683 / 1980 / Ss-1) TaxID=665079 RepID=A7E659_SCLS1|nr:predicted protein [Sclerotinia sclerotiorum 1980 UF-70]EDN91381.1 predicted protein [Sclerotinia sclerotiorum 1980 UF-70]
MTMIMKLKWYCLWIEAVETECLELGSDLSATAHSPNIHCTTPRRNPPNGLPLIHRQDGLREKQFYAFSGFLINK